MVSIVILLKENKQKILIIEYIHFYLQITNQISDSFKYLTSIKFCSYNPDSAFDQYIQCYVNINVILRLT